MAKKIQQIAEFPVFDAPIPAMQNQQSRFIPPGRGLLRDQFRRQGKVEIGGLHEQSFKFQAGSFKPAGAQFGDQSGDFEIVNNFPINVACHRRFSLTVVG